MQAIRDNGVPLYQAICQVMQAVQEIRKDARNSYAKYDYATADAVFEHIRPLLGDFGLVIETYETDAEITDGLFRATYSFTLRHVDGSTTTPETVLIANKFVGPQSLQAARTYALKYWLRSKFVLATGDADMDAQEPLSTSETSDIAARLEDL